MLRLPIRKINSKQQWLQRFKGDVSCCDDITKDSVLQNAHFLICMLFMGSTFWVFLRWHFPPGRWTEQVWWLSGLISSHGCSTFKLEVSVSTTESLVLMLKAGSIFFSFGFTGITLFGSKSLIWIGVDHDPHNTPTAGLFNHNVKWASF